MPGVTAVQSACKVDASSHDRLLLCAGKFQEAAHSAAAQARDFTDRSARGDHILWLHPGRPPATSNSQLMSLVHAVQVMLALSCSRSLRCTHLNNSAV